MVERVFLVKYYSWRRASVCAIGIFPSTFLCFCLLWSARGAVCDAAADGRRAVHWLNSTALPPVLPVTSLGGDASALAQMRNGGA